MSEYRVRDNEDGTYTVTRSTVLHKARPAHGERGYDKDDCFYCAETIQRVPGGQGPTWVHLETGAVAGTGPDNAERRETSS